MNGENAQVTRQPALRDRFTTTNLRPWSLGHPRKTLNKLARKHPIGFEQSLNVSQQHLPESIRLGLARCAGQLCKRICASLRPVSTHNLSNRKKWSPVIGQPVKNATRQDRVNRFKLRYLVSHKTRQLAVKLFFWPDLTRVESLG